MAEEKKDKKEKKVGPKTHAAMTKDEPKEKKSDTSGKKDGGKVRHKITHIEHHGPGKGHTVRHSPGEAQEVSYAAPDLNSVNAGMQQNVSDVEDTNQAPPAAPSGPMPTPGAGV